MIAVAISTGCGAVVASDALSDGFRNPPDAAKPYTWWHWMNGNISREGITADLEAMKRVGVGGAQIFNVDCGIPAGPTRFMSPDWREMIKHAVSEAGRLGLELCIHNCAGWSSSGGPWVKPEQAMQELVWTETTAKGPAPFSEALKQPEARADYYRDIAVFAFKANMAADAKERIQDIEGKAGVERRDRIDPDVTPTSGPCIPLEGVLDLTNRMASDGRLTWDVPDGDWTILRIGYSPSGRENAPAAAEGRGLECDKMSKEALDAHWAGMMGKVIQDIGPLAGKVLNNSLIDSYEVGCQNWTASFRQEFQKRRGYDPLPYLPITTGRIIDSREVSERFLWDFRRTIADLFADNYFGHFAELCHQNGMISSAETYGNGGFDNIQCGGKVDIVMGEFWVPSGSGGGSTKMAASSAHTHGTKVVGAESFTAEAGNGRWLVDPYSIKALGDRIYCNGVNRFIFHRYAHQPWLNVKPGMTMGPWGMNFERTVTWWDQGAAWLKYTARCQFMLQSGRFAADACYFTGEAAPNDLPERGDLRPALSDGYDYDGCDAGVVMQRMSVGNGRLVLPDGMSYRVLVLPESRFMTVGMLRKIRDLVQAGATVVGPKPLKSPSLADYPACDEQVKSLADEVWGDCDGVSVKEHTFGKGRVFWGKSMQEVFAELSLKPDFESGSRRVSVPLNWIHRTVGAAEVYFVANPRYASTQVDCTFRVAGKVPQFWHPDTGKIEDAPVYVEKNGQTTLPIRFDPAGSVFVVFRKPSTGRDHLASVARFSGKAGETAPSIEIVKAVYGAPGDATRSADVTSQVAGMVAGGQFSIPATNGLFGDPALDVVKELRVEYMINGKPVTKAAAENETVDLAIPGKTAAPEFDLTRDARGRAALLAWQPGVYTLKTAAGKTRKIEVNQGARSVALAGPWQLSFPSGWGAPARVTLNKLISWTEHSEAGVRYFSGTAQYTKDFDLPSGVTGPGSTVVLDLGRVKNLAEVTLNGKKLGVLWKEPFRVDATGVARAGRNHLEVRVTNLWPNRIIGDEQQPDDCQWTGDWAGESIAAIPQWVAQGGKRPQSERYTFTTWRLYSKDSPLLESGLLGPVVVRSAKGLDVSVR